MNHRGHGVRRGRLPSRLGCALLFLTWWGEAARAERIIYVRAEAGGANSGLTWDDAYTDLQDALDDAKINGGCPCEIWVAAGTYKPDRGTGDQTLAFELANNIAVYGGFAGWEQCREERDARINESILNGDLNGDDDPTAEPTSGCCFDYAVCENVACRDLVIAAMPRCAVMWHPDCAALAVGLCCDICRPTRCDNSYNVVVAIDTDRTPVLDGLTIESGEGVGSADILPVEPCGGLYCHSSWLTVSRCIFRANTSGMCAMYGPPTLTDSLFVHNGDRFFSGAPALYMQDANLGYGAKLSGCTFLENLGPGIETFEGNLPIESCRFIRNAGGGLWNYQDYGVRDITNCTFINNHYSGMNSYGNVRLTNCAFFGNSHPNFGGGLQMSYGSPTLINCVFSGNRAGGDSYPGWGGAFAGSGAAMFSNCTLVGNYASRGGGISGEHAILRNCVLWGNSDQYGTSQYSQASAVRADFSIIQGWDGSIPGTGTTSADPLPLDPLGPDGIAGTDDDNLRLSPGSPAINAGDPNTSGLPATDLDGHGRVLCGRVDIGAYEFGIGDFNCDQQVTLADFSSWSACMNGPSGAELRSEKGKERMANDEALAGSIENRQSAIDNPCAAFDFDGDGDTDLSDLAGFQRVFAGQ